MTAGAERKGNGERMRDEKINQIQIAIMSCDAWQHCAMPPAMAYSATSMPKICGNPLRHPSNPHASKVSRRVELMTTALKTVRRVTTKIPRERLVVMTAGARRKGVGERVGDEKRDRIQMVATYCRRAGMLQGICTYPEPCTSGNDVHVQLPSMCCVTHRTPTPRRSRDGLS